MSATIEDALELVAIHFKGVTDEDGEPYVLHCLRVMQGVADPKAQQAALMHDLVEDTDISLEDLQARGFSAEVVHAVDLLTHRAEDSYADYVLRLSQDPLARQVKLADLRDNSNVSRVLYRERCLAKDVRRIGRYILSSQFLSGRLTEVDYRRRMAELEQA